jgi:hypothetical protein
MYRTIQTSLWSDPKIKTIPANGKLLFVYLITNPHTHVSGIYYLPSLFISYETSLSSPDLAEAMDILIKADLVALDKENEIVWVKNMLRYQGGGINIMLAVAKQMKELQRSNLVEKFIKHYSYLNIPLRSPSKGVLKGVSTPSEGGTVPVPISVPVFIKNKDIKKTRKEETSSALVFSCRHFEVEDEYFQKLLTEYPALTPEILAREFSKMADWLTDNPNKHKRTAKGQLKNQRSFIRRWIDKFELFPNSGANGGAPAPRIRKTSQEADPFCLACAGKGVVEVRKEGKHVGSRACSCLK